MRKVLFVLLILILCAIMFLISWYGIPSLEFAKTYVEVEDAFTDYESTLKTLKNKNDSELPAAEAKLSKDYTAADTDNVVKQYNENKKYYEDLVALQRANNAIGSADIYDIGYIWATLGKYAGDLSISMSMDVEKSAADLNSEDYIMCNLIFELTGKYQNIAEFIDTIELDTDIAFQINDFFMEGYSSTARNQSKSTNMDTNNIPSSESADGSTVYDASLTGSGSSNTLESDNSHKFDVRANFKVYNVPLNKKTITNVKSADESAVPATLGTDSSDTTVY